MPVARRCRPLLLVTAVLMLAGVLVAHADEPARASSDCSWGSARPSVAQGLLAQASDGVAWHVTSNDVNTISAEFLDANGWHDAPDLLRLPTENNLYRPYLGGLAAFRDSRVWAGLTSPWDLTVPASQITTTSRAFRWSGSAWEDRTPAAVAVPDSAVITLGGGGDDDIYLAGYTMDRDEDGKPGAQHPWVYHWDGHTWTDT